MLAMGAALALSWFLRAPPGLPPSALGAPAAVSSASVAAPQQPPVAPVGPESAAPWQPEGQAERPYPIDLEGLRRELPDNLYWATSLPTKDPAVIEARAAEARGWNIQLGKVQAGEASLDEVHAYFEHERRVSQDALDFSAHVLHRYAAQLPERDLGLFELSARMNRDKLADLPRLEAEGVARKKQQDARRAAWEAGGKQ
jgi:hypothetical protein